MDRFHTKHTYLDFESAHFPEAPTLVQRESNIAQRSSLSLSVTKFDSLRNE